jgi:RNA polymerase sigma-70 factor (ECF subfamily)
MDENKLIEEALNNREAAEQLIRIHYKEVYSYIYKRTLDKNLTEELTQEVFLYALEHLASFKRKCPFVIWALKIAMSHIADYYRKGKKYSQLSQEMEQSLPSSVTVDDPPEETDAYRIIYKHLESIPISYKEIIILKFFENRKTKEICEIMHKTPVGVRVTLYRALNALKKELESDVTDLNILRLYCGEGKDWPAFAPQNNEEEETE